MSPTIYNINSATIRGKMASFDYDWTDGKSKRWKNLSNIYR